MSLERALARLDHSPPRIEPGHVWLAGAGPGDPGCLTLDVLAAIAGCDTLVHDALVSPAVLSVAQGAELIDVGKRGGRPSMRQEEISALLVRLAREDRRVLRLKGGDPYVFGRGAEEALMLVRENIPFRVLPGLTSAFGGLAGVGIPATMRGVNKAIILATGHTADAEDPLDWAALARTGQPVIIYMGLQTLGAIVAALIAGGLPPETPAAAVMAATLREERVVTATLATIEAEAHRAGIASPALFVVGGIVSLRAELGRQA